jgi:hypothetical protein
MSYAEATPGPRNIEAAQRLAAALHPERKISVQRVEFSQESCREQASPHHPTCRPQQAAAPSLAIILLSRGGAYTAGLTELGDWPRDWRRP